MASRPRQDSLGSTGLSRSCRRVGEHACRRSSRTGPTCLVDNGSGSGTSGLYGLTGQVSGNTVQLYATNYTLTDLDPTYLYGITDSLSNVTPPGTSLSFSLIDTAPSDSNFKGVSFAPTIPNGDVEITSSPSGLAFTSSGTGCAPGTYAPHK